MSDEDVAKLIGSIGRYLPTSVKQVLIRGDAEFIGAKTVEACQRHGYNFIFANKRCTPDFEETNWYTKKDYAYNEVQHHPLGWQQPCRFVAMRMDRTREEDNAGAEQLSLFGSDRYKYRVFATNLKWLPHVVIKKYDKRADVENLVGEAQREGIPAIPSKRFLSNHAFFQIVMLAYNIWRWMKIMAACERRGNHDAQDCVLDGAQEINVEVMDQTIRIARLKMLFLPAKITTSGRRVKVSYSSHDARSEGVCDFLSYLDRRRKVPVQWIDNVPLGSWRSAA